MNRYHVKHSSIYYQEKEMGEPVLVDVVVDEVLHLTAAGVKVLVNGEEEWLTLSQLEDADELEKGQENIIIAMPIWLAKEKNFEWE